VLLQFVAPALLSITSIAVGYHFGQLAETRKEVTAEEQLYLNQRMRVFADTAAHFAQYNINSARLVHIALFENKAALTKAERARKERYLTDSDKARDLLFADLMVVRVFFSREVVDLVDEFETFDAQHSQSYAVDLEPILHKWREHQFRILSAMLKEVRQPEDKNEKR
jgi:hypothetical protein